MDANEQAAVAKLVAERDALKAALKVVMNMDVKGHSLANRLQFSTPGREILKQATDALAMS